MDKKNEGSAKINEKEKKAWNTPRLLIENVEDTKAGPPVSGASDGSWS